MQGFTDGVMEAGPHAGKKVSEAKPIIKEEMLAAGQALPYRWVGGPACLPACLHDRLSA